MNSDKIKLTFQCRQNWDSMPLVDGQRQCGQCNRTVFDLRDKTRAEIREQFKNNSSELCGLFYQEQVEEEPSRQFFNPKIFVAGLAALFTLNTARLSAQTQKPVLTEQRDTASSPNVAARNDASHATYSLTRSESKAIIQGPDPKKNREGRLRVYFSWRFPFIHIYRFHARTMLGGRFIR